MEWRGDFFEDKYTAVIFIMLVIFAFVWAFALIWDMRLRMWREQQTVLAERNPYAKEKMTSKEIAIYSICWLPLLEQLGKTDPEMKKAAEYLRVWLEKAYTTDPIAAEDLKDIMDYLGNGRSMPFNLKK